MISISFLVRFLGGNFILDDCCEGVIFIFIGWFESWKLSCIELAVTFEICIVILLFAFCRFNFFWESDCYTNF